MRDTVTYLQVAPGCEVVLVGRKIIGSIVHDPSNAPAVWVAYVVEDDDEPTCVATRISHHEAVEFVLVYSGNR